MEFIPEVLCDLKSIRGRLVYEIDDDSFNFIYEEPDFTAGRSCICFGDYIQVAIDLRNGQLLGVSGLSNYQIWTNTSLIIPKEKSSSGLILKEFSGLISGVGYAGEREGNDFESKYYDPETGWFCTGNPNTETVVQFATNCFAALNENLIDALWLRPENWRDINTGNLSLIVK